MLLTIEGVWLATRGYAEGVHHEGMQPLSEVLASVLAAGGEIWACGSRSLAPQGTMIVTITAKTPATPGNYSLQNLADPNNTVAESDEGNNQANQSIQVN